MPAHHLALAYEAQPVMPGQIQIAASVLALATALHLQISTSDDVAAQTPKPKPTASPSATKPAPIKTLILPGEAFLVSGRPAFVFLPPPEKRRTPQPWIMYGPTLPGLPDNAEKFMHEKFLAAGVAVAGIDQGESYGSPKGQALMTDLYNELTTKRGFGKKVCLLGRSRGGLQMTSWAVTHPELVAGIAGIYPVLDLRSYPGLARAASAYQLTPKQLEERLAEHNPIAKGDVVAKARIPLFLVHGDVDKLVPLEPNSAALVEHYKKAGAADVATLVVPKGQGHNMWEGFFRSEELIAFAIRQAEAGAAAADKTK